MDINQFVIQYWNQANSCGPTVTILEVGAVKLSVRQAHSINSNLLSRPACLFFRGDSSTAIQKKLRRRGGVY